MITGRSFQSYETFQQVIEFLRADIVDNIQRLYP